MNKWKGRFSILFLCCCIACLANTQEKSRVQALIDEGLYDEARFHCDSILSDPDHKSNYAYYHSKLGDVYYFLGDLQKSLKSYLNALDDSGMNVLERRYLKEETTSYVGFCYRELGLSQKAEEYFQKALKLSIEIRDSVEIATAYYNMSTVLLEQGKLDESMDMLQKAYEIDVIRKDTSAIGFDLTVMGNAMVKTRQFDKAANFYKQSIDLLEISTGNYNSLAKRCGLLAEAFIELENWDSAKYYTNQAVDLYAKQSDSILVGMQWVRLARIENETDNYDQALYWGVKAKLLFEKYPTSSAVISANSSLAHTHKRLGDNMQAINLLKENVDLTKRLGLLYEHRDSYLQLAQAYEKTGKYGQAFQSAQKANVLTDSITRLETNKATERMRVRYDAERIESENRLLELENEVTKANLAERDAEFKVFVLIGIIILILAISSFVLVVLRSRMKMKLLLSETGELRSRIKGILEFKPEEVGIVKEQINDSLQHALTDREFEILNLALSNLNNSEIADKVHLSVNTVKFHLKNIYQKLGVSNRKEALKYAVQVTAN
ncbi:MAG: hypothetical protein CMB80_20415 [Flammeovirgaceae bacterium]|nr:hypothetical protein [Flammeovirgaceae bacterium]MBE63136.1 hypothetical protein [Flammeovirgaceae bacterium]HCX20950.1 hypothetical protein [Cytophagales bacterium]|tara:strand:+ start:6906 stop:8558 length:1653 start_codon:yes stop_codon:yes gene_type:complete